MLNVGGGEFLVILLVALIVLGPTKLPEVARQVGKVASELRRMSMGFQQELKDAMEDTVEDDARERGRRVVSSEQDPAPTADDQREISTAEAAGMYDVGNGDEGPSPDAATAEPDRPDSGEGTAP